MYGSILKMIGNTLLLVAATSLTAMGMILLITAIPWNIVVGGLFTGFGIGLLTESSKRLADSISEYKFHRRYKERTSELGHSEEGEQLSSSISSPQPADTNRNEKKKEKFYGNTGTSRH
ncbi:MAG: hypothetical protein K0R63_857 [Rickettsiales bacterium]|nr:hypothetical protein [Rickettsiales bacterium]